MAETIIPYIQIVDDDGEDDDGMMLGGFPKILPKPKKDIRDLLKIAE